MIDASRRPLLLGLGSSILAARFGVAAEAPAPVTSVASYGARPDGSDAGPGVKAAIAALPRTGGATLQFPPGRYHFKQHGGYAIDIAGIDRLTLDGGGSTFLFEGSTSPLRVTGCAAPLLRGFTIDFERPPFSQGQVVGVSDAGRTVDFAIDGEFPVDGSEKIETIATYDRRTGLMANGGLDLYGGVQDTALIDAQKLRVHLQWQLPQLRAGDTIVLRHNVYGNHAITISSSTSIRVQDVTLYAAGGMGVVGGDNEDLTIERLNILPTPGTRRLMSICADGVHMASCRGKISVTDCHMQDMGDDCVNVNTPYLTIVQRVDARTAVIAKPNKSPFGAVDIARAGATFTIIDGQTLAKLAELAVVGAEGGAQETVHFGADLPATLRPGDLMLDGSRRAALLVSRCDFPGNRARGVLGHQDVTIERCRFMNQSHEAVLLMPDAKFAEGPAVDAVTVVNNEITNSWTQGSKPGAVAAGAIRVGSTVPAGAAPTIVNRNINLSSNHIIGSGAAGIVVDDASDVTIAGNTIERCRGPALILGAIAAVRVTRNVVTPASTVMVDSKRAAEVKMSGNVGLLL